MKGKSLLALALCAVGIGSAWGLDAKSTYRPYFNFGPQYVFADDDARFADDGIGGYLGFGVPISPILTIGFNAFYDTLDGKGAGGGVDWDEFGGEIEGLFTYQGGNGWVPYIVGAVGVMHSELDPGDADSDDPVGSVGLGVFKYFTAGATDLALRLDTRYRVVDLPGKLGFDDPEEVVVRLGLVVPFGEPIFGRQQAVTQTTSPDKDSDGDGVMDSKDQCPGTPPGVKVDATGCPLDSDGDGVPDYLDKCPDTPKGVKVDANGCALAGQTLVLNSVFFEFDSDRLTQQGVATLDKAVSGLQKNPQIRLLLTGHTDSVGTDAYNVALSERRANSVRKYLVSKGIESSRLSTQAYGESRPEADNDTAEGRAKNRRVDLNVAE